MAQESPPRFEKILGRADLLLFSVSAILTIDSLASSASVGVTWFTWWTIAIVLFFVPYGLMTAELGAAWPGEGGLYIWVREAMGPKWGSLAAWFYWINVAYWIPSVYMVFAGTLHTIFLKAFLAPNLQSGVGAVWLQAGIAALVTWLTVGIGVAHLRVAKWIPNTGAIVKVAIFLSLGTLGLIALAKGKRPANDFSLASFIPNKDAVPFLPVLVYNVLGFELMSAAGDEMRAPQRDVPRVILLSGFLITLLYILGVLGILIAVPVADLQRQTGTWDALYALGTLWGSVGRGFVFFLGIGFLYACVTNIVTWSMGANRVAAAAAQRGALPVVLGRTHPRFHTPYMAFILMGVISTLLLIGNAIFAADASNAFWLIFKLSGLCCLISYLLVFPAFLFLRKRRPDHQRPYTMPGGMVGAWLGAILCWIFIACACVLFFKPAPGASAVQVWREAILLGSETALTLLAGLWFVRQAGRAVTSSGS